ncbi:MAG: hypothetical protein L6Q29_02060 [Candidatus Pacebacteria bacterium]|nr:hypothetical protein [Candidatus Paceibacterota bacterium]NUQ56968.1 hypothetical protein [Candidatus Paceibacter sp.]
MVKEKIIAAFNKYEVPENFFLSWFKCWQDHFARFPIPADPSYSQEVLTEEEYLELFLKKAKERGFHAPW